jgi:hypothetical protein
MAYRFLFGVSGDYFDVVRGLSPGDRVHIERQEGEILINRVPVQRFYQKTIQGIMEMTGAGIRKLRGRG